MQPWALWVNQIPLTKTLSCLLTSAGHATHLGLSFLIYTAGLGLDLWALSSSDKHESG